MPSSAFEHLKKSERELGDHVVTLAASALLPVGVISRMIAAFGAQATLAIVHHLERQVRSLREKGQSIDTIMGMHPAELTPHPTALADLATALSEIAKSSER